MEFEVGSILTGKVTAITKFGAFVSLPSGRSGLVHISEIANTYVSNIADFIKEGQEVSVKVIKIDDTGRINLSIKQTQEPAFQPPQRTERAFQRNPNGQPQQGQRQFGGNQLRDRNFQRSSANDRRLAYAGKESTQPAEDVQSASAVDSSFEDKLKRFMQDSDSKISGLYSEKKTSRRRNNRG